MPFLWTYIHTYTPGPKTLKSWTSNVDPTTEKLIHWVQQRNLRILLLRVTALLKLKIVPLQAYHCNNRLWQPTYLYLQVPIPSLLVWSDIQTPLAWLHFVVGNMAKRHRGGDLRCPYLDIQNVQTTNVITANVPMLSSNCLIPSTTKCLCSLQSDIHTTLVVVIIISSYWHGNGRKSVELQIETQSKPASCRSSRVWDSCLLVRSLTWKNFLLLWDYAVLLSQFLWTGRIGLYTRGNLEAKDRDCAEYWSMRVFCEHLACEDDNPNFWIIPCEIERSLQFHHRQRPERVPSFRPIDGYLPHRTQIR